MDNGNFQARGHLQGQFCSKLSMKTSLSQLLGQQKSAKTLNGRRYAKMETDLCEKSPTGNRSVTLLPFFRASAPIPVQANTCQGQRADVNDFTTVRDKKRREKGERERDGEMER
jgi:hypothetical protein